MPAVKVPLGPAVVNITGVRAGDRNLFTIYLTENGTPVDLTGQTVTAQARTTATDSTIAITCVCTVTDAPGGVLTLAFPGAAVTTALAGAPTWSGVWDLQVKAGAADPVTLLAGGVTAVSDVTRP